MRPTSDLAIAMPRVRLHNSPVNLDDYIIQSFRQRFDRTAEIENSTRKTDGNGTCRTEWIAMTERRFAGTMSLSEKRNEKKSASRHKRLE